MKKGFTLIELLVVVLIIGILAAVALPQYNYTVTKSRYAALIPEMRAFGDSLQRYYLEHGSYPLSAEELDIDATGANAAYNNSYGQFQVLSRVGSYDDKEAVWLTLRGAHDFEYVCETFASYRNGVKICESLKGIKRPCGDTISQAFGEIVCYTLPMPHANKV